MLTYGIATAAVLRLVLIVAGVDIGGCWAGDAGRQCFGRPHPGSSSTGLWPPSQPLASLPPTPQPPAVERFEPVLLLFAGILILSSAKLLM